MTHIIEIDSKLLAEIDGNDRNFIIQKSSKPIKAGDTVILQAANLENAFTVTAIATPEEDNGLKSGWQALTLKAKGE